MKYGMLIALVGVVTISGYFILESNQESRNSDFDREVRKPRDFSEQKNTLSKGDNRKITNEEAGQLIVMEEAGIGKSVDEGEVMPPTFVDRQEDEHSHDNGHDSGIKYLLTINNDINGEYTPTNPDFSRHGTPISINEESIRSLRKNELLNFPLDKNRTLLVESVDKKNSGAVNVRFSVANEDNIYRGFITVGNKATFGRIITPEGGYELEVVDGKGWIVNTSYIDDKMPEDGIDYVAPRN
ncbi:hypothetical protein [Microbulbifer sp. VAAF005]|uniref:hypothetical protein n=1 Tax=Microbulbifer sp. VAAF005 TaxID=3034230 RepID=UPI0024AC951F|nr:hypothetical protein [Microbulbifer sp. VAAF005]WHI46187.1 hypothetical protein P0078_21090 [Microbulbifer sp. VAAF005]